MRCCKIPRARPRRAHLLLPRAGDCAWGRGGDASGAGIQPPLVAGLRAPSVPGSNPHLLCRARDDAKGPQGPMGTPRDRADVAWLGAARALAKSHRPGRGGTDLLLPLPAPAPQAGSSGARPSGLWFGGWIQPLAMAEAPKEHRAVPGAVSGSWVLQSPSSRGFGVPRGSVPPRQVPGAAQARDRDG